jgi:hypothetical protein
VTTSDGVTVNVASARVQNSRAACASRRFDTRTSMTCPCWSTAVDIAPDAVDLHACFVDEPPLTGGVPDEAGRIGKQRREPLHPPVDGEVVDVDPALGQQLFEIAVGKAIAQIPAHRQHDHLGRKPEPGERRTLRQ